MAGCLVVEDPFICKYLAALLGQRGYGVRVAGVEGAVRLLRAGSGREDVLITNVPDRFVEFAQDTPVLYLAGLPDPSLVSGFRASRVLRKPFRADQFLAALEELCAGRAKAQGA